MQIISTTVDLIDWSLQQIRAGQRIVLVPTMGFFHEGHLTLMRTASQNGDKVVVSLFVNPLQFGPSEDLDSYPKDLDRDAEMAEKEGVDVLFVPSALQMYDGHPLTNVSVSNLTESLCGKSRPGHFNGVSTVVAKLFNIVRPDAAVFGCKDFQQLAVIRRMVKDLNFNIEIIAQPTVREDDGLAMSSRNSYLSSDEREQALCLNAAIRKARQVVSDGKRESGPILAELKEFVGAFDKVEIEYIEIVDSNDLTSVELIDADSLLAIAVKVGNTRLIDNSMLI